MRNANKAFRDYAKKKGVYLYEIAEVAGLPESTFYRHLRIDFSAPKLAEMMAIVDRIAAERNDK